MVVPRALLTMLGWSVVDVVAARLVAAALLAIGIESLLARNRTLLAFPALLNLKIIWSAAALVGLIWSAAAGAHGRPWSLWLFVAVFGAFHLLWIYWRVRVKALIESQTPSRVSRSS